MCYILELYWVFTGWILIFYSSCLFNDYEIEYRYWICLLVLLFIYPAQFPASIIHRKGSRLLLHRFVSPKLISVQVSKRYISFQANHRKAFGARDHNISE